MSNADTTRTRAYSDLSTVRSRYDGDELSADEALRPDKVDDSSFQVTENPFAYSPGQLNKMQNPKSLAAYKALGGIRGLQRGLRTDLVAGLGVDESTLDGSVSFEEAITAAKLPKVADVNLARENTRVKHEVPGIFVDRKRVYRDNRLPAKDSLSIWRLFWNAFNDRILILLTGAAVVSLALGIYEVLSKQSSVDWIEGLAILIAVVIVVLVTGMTDYRREKQFVELNAKKEDRTVKAIRSGKSVQVSIFDITVGDVLHLESGDSVPADGVLISGYGIRCDESSATGESDAMRKMTGDEVSKRIEDGTANNKIDPFIISGSKVLEGVGTYLVTSVGVNSSHGKIMVSLQTDVEQTPLQVKLARMANWIGYLGMSAATLLFFILLIRFLANLSSSVKTTSEKGSQFLQILIVAITIVVVAVPEGLPVAVTLALAFATKRMFREHNLVRQLRACETMGNATTICSDKTGTLTQNEMTVVAGSLGSDLHFAREAVLVDGEEKVHTLSNAFKQLSPSVRSLLLQLIVINSTAFEGEEDGRLTFIGSKTETALLMLAKDHLGMGPVAEERSGVEVVQLIPFNSDRKCMGVAVRLSSGVYRLLVKGAAEIMLANSTKQLVDTAATTLEDDYLSDSARDQILMNITDYAKESLRTIGLLYRDFQQWPPLGTRTLDGEKSLADFDDLFHSMTLIGVVGIQDPIRDGVPRAVKQCQDAGITVRMVTGDNVTTAVAIASQCGIKTSDGLVMDGPKFRQLSDEDLCIALPKLQVLARSSPEDKRILVAKLKQLGETVAVTGDGTNDAPALKTADIGFSMGIAGTEVAKEASSIILMNDNFSSIIQAIMWGRSVNDAVAKFLQFQITVNITAVILAFISAISSPDFKSVLSAVQLLWVNLIMDTFAALALATDAPTERILNRKPAPKSAPLITTNMWKMIIGQAIYQLAITFTLYFAGAKILDYDLTQQAGDNAQTRLDKENLKTQLNTMVFNTFVWMQIFNEFNNRRLDNHLNIFEGVHRNYFFLIINAIMIGGQVLIIFVGGTAFQITAIGGTQWAVCILCSFPCLIWAIALRLIPDKYAGMVFGFAGKIYFAAYRPVERVCKAIFQPIARAARSTSAAISRFSRRTAAKVFRKKGDRELERPTGDAERGAEMVLSPAAPSPTTPRNLPPITLTTMD